MIRLDVSKPKLPWHAVLCTAVLVLFTVIWSAQSALASDSGLVGRIEAMPPQGLLGEWAVGGLHFVTSGATEFRQERGEFAIGRCVEVEYVTVAEQNLATKVATKSNDDCQGDDTPTVTPPNVTPTVTPAPTGSVRSASTTRR